MIVAALLSTVGCSTMKESHTARTGIEQLLISSATDRALDQVDLRPIAGGKVYLETKYLDCTDKNYIIVAMHQRLLQNRCELVEKPEDAQVIVEVASGGVGTDGTELFVGVPEIPLPPPSPISVPKLSIMERKRSIGTAKLTVVAYDAQSRAAVINSGYALARSDHRTWNVLGVGGYNSGSVHDDLARRTGDVESASAAVASRGGLLR